MSMNWPIIVADLIRWRLNINNDLPNENRDKIISLAREVAVHYEKAAGCDKKEFLEACGIVEEVKEL